MSSEGILNQISVGKESTYGTAVTPTYSVPVLPSDGIVVEQETVGVEAIDTHPAKNKGFVRGVRNYTGGYNMNAYPNALGYVLLSALGAVSTSTVGGESVVYEHIFTETVAKKSLTVEQVIGSVTERFAGFIASGFNLQFKVGEPISVGFEGMAKTVASNTKITPVYETRNAFKWDQISSISLDSVDLKAYIESGNIEYKNGLGTFHGFSSNNEPTLAYVENSELTGSFTALMDGTNVDALSAKFRSQTEMPISFMVTGESAGIASNCAIVLTIPRAVVSTYVTKLDTSYNQVTFDFVAGKDSSDGLIEFILVNTKTTY